MATLENLISLDDFFQNTNIGSIERAIGNNLYGLNHRQIPGLVPSNKDQYGLVFFTRPQLNLSPGNLRNVRQFYPLLTNNEYSIQRYIRTTLDPRLMVGYEGNAAIGCPFVDPQQVFIPALTNFVNSLSGWPDMTGPTLTTEPGVYNEAYSQIDGITRNFESFDLDVTFRNTRGDPIVYMMYIWLRYASLAFEGLVVPYTDYLVANMIDYMTRIYRLVLDESRKYVRKIAATGVAFPISVPIGSFVDFNNERPFNDQNKDITIRFRALGAEYYDDILILEFNKAVTIFNPTMAKLTDLKRSAAGDITFVGTEGKFENAELVKVPGTLLTYFNNRGYPWINPDNYELEWWIPASVYNARLNGVFSNPTKDVKPDDEENTGD